MSQDEFKECETCSAKPGSPLLCAGCRHNREVIAGLLATNLELAKLLKETKEFIAGVVQKVGR